MEEEGAGREENEKYGSRESGIGIGIDEKGGGYRLLACRAENCM